MQEHKSLSDDIARAATGRPHQRLVLRGAMVVDGTGAPPYGPTDIIIEQERIVGILKPGTSPWQNQTSKMPDYGPGDTVIDVVGRYVLPGLIDAHAHIGGPKQVPSPEYVYKLWLGHGVTTVREVGSLYNGLDFTLAEAAKSDAFEIVAPRISPYVYFGWGAKEWITDASAARDWVGHVAGLGARGVKFFGTTPNVMEAALDEARKLGLRTACHHAQQDVAQANALTTSRWGLGSIEHWYGVPEAMFTHQRVQRYPADYNYLDETSRFATAGRLWQESAPPGSNTWNETIDELVGNGTAFVPTLNVYIGARDAARVRTSEWHERYTARELRSFFAPSSGEHGSFFSGWGTEEEVSWRRSYKLWMQFVADFHARGGLLGAGSDSGFIYKVYGFGIVEELELLREAGISPLEIIGIATLNGARLLGLEDQTGSIEVGKRADLMILAENPLKNLKVLYGHGHTSEEGQGEDPNPGGVLATIKSGALYDAPAALADVRGIVAEQQLLGRTFETAHSHQ